MSAINFYEKINTKKEKNYKNFDLVRISLPMRILATGNSGSGKTNILMNLLSLMGCFAKIYLVVKDEEEPLYKYFISSIRDSEEKLGAIKNKKEYKKFHIDNEILHIVKNPLELPEINSFSEQDKSHKLVIFDDYVSCSKKEMDAISNYFIRGRKRNISCVFLSQNYYAANTKTIRRNCTIFIFKKLIKSDIEKIMEEQSLGISKEQLIKAYHKCDSFLGCLLLDPSNPDEKYRVRNFLTPIERSSFDVNTL